MVSKSHSLEASLRAISLLWIASAVTEPLKKVKHVLSFDGNYLLKAYTQEKIVLSILHVIFGWEDTVN